MNRTRVVAQVFCALAMAVLTPLGDHPRERRGAVTVNDCDVRDRARHDSEVSRRAVKSES